MKIINKIRRKFNYIRNKGFMKENTEDCYRQLSSVHVQPTIYYMCTPIHPNLGDQAQLVCFRRWFKQNYPDYEVVECCSRTMPTYWLKLIKEKIKPSDIIFIHSGYLFLNMESDVPVILKLVETFKSNKIIILPQTVNFANKDVEQRFSAAFAQNNNITLLCRDFVSYEKAKAVFPDTRCFPFPDIVTSLIGTRSFNSVRNGVCFCLRDDNEKYYSDKELATLSNKLSKYGCDRVDTTLRVPLKKMNSQREDLINEMIVHLSNVKVVITDRYHGTIFSVIANTPIIVINSTDHKLSSGVKWFPREVFGDAIQYADTLDKAYDLAVEILESKKHELHNPPYFSDKYWSKLKNQL